MRVAGIVANPASGKDIRRLVAYGTVFDNNEKVNIVKRILLGLEAVGIEKTVYMPDYYGILPRALDGLRKQLKMCVEPVDIELTGTQIDSMHAAEAMAKLNVGCIVVLGGDGTNRMVAKGCADVPLLSVSTGTNNVFPEMVEGTIAGMAAGVVARGHYANGAVKVAKKLIIRKNGADVDIGLVDAVVVDGNFVGSRAMWEIRPLMQAVVTRAKANNIGIASIAGNLMPVDTYEPRGMQVIFDPDREDILAPIAPGLILPVGIKEYRYIGPDEPILLPDANCIIALDGEREVEVRRGDRVEIVLSTHGPHVVDIEGALSGAVEQRNALKTGK
ncbi:MAG: ATP-NAD kinase family protein [Bacillota bacterium]